MQTDSICAFAILSIYTDACDSVLSNVATITQVMMSVHQVHVTLMLCVLTLMGPSHALALEDSQEMDSCVKVNRAQ